MAYQLVEEGGCYSFSTCHENIERFLELLKSQPDFKIEDAHILYMFISGDQEKNPRRFVAQNSRNAEFISGGWNWHVVLEYHGKIYDLDAETPEPISISKFFSGLKNIGNLQVRRIPATDYRSDKRYRVFGPVDGELPMPVSDYLAIYK